jgi:hypothetical protein
VVDNLLKNKLYLAQSVLLCLIFLLKTDLLDCFSLYFNYDTIIEVESKTIIQTILLDKEVFTLIKTLRERNLTVNECLNILNNKEELFNELLDKKYFYEAAGLVFIFSSVRFIKFIPYYIIEKLIERYKNREISLNEYLTHVQLLAEQLDIHPFLDYEIV